MRLLKSVVVAGLVAFTAVAAEAQIQTPDTASTAVNGAYSALDLQIPRGIPMSTRSGMARALADVDRKDPALAGILSFLIPGVGSFYAGNSTHGFIHLGIHVVSYVLIVSSVSNAVNDCAFGDCSSSSTSGGELALGSIVLLGNDVWSIFTAVGDAHAHNGDQAKPGHVVGSLYFRPDVVRIGVPTPEGTSGRAGVQAFRVEF